MSAQHFEVGEIAIYWRPGSMYHNTEVQILRAAEFVGGGFRKEDGSCVEACVAHWTRGQDGIEAWAKLSELRKKRPPRDDLKSIRWDQCPWQPAKVRA